MPPLPNESKLKPTSRRVEAFIFVTLFLAYGYFFQGGGWNQNSRFDQIRAIVEAGELHINNFSCFANTPPFSAGGALVRLQLGDVLQPPEGAQPPNTGDLSVFNNRIYPNKPPGTTFLGVPAYFVI